MGQTLPPFRLQWDNMFKGLHEKLSISGHCGKWQVGRQPARPDTLGQAGSPAKFLLLAV